MGRCCSKKFKKEVVAASYAEGVSAASVARQFEVPDSALYYWRKRYGRPILQRGINLQPIVKASIQNTTSLILQAGCIQMGMRGLMAYIGVIMINQAGKSQACV